MNHHDIVIALIAAFVLAGPALATPQTDKMKSCNATAKEQTLKGDARRDFMSQCLSSKPDPDKLAKREKVKSCTADAKEKSLKGDERKKFISECAAA